MSLFITSGTITAQFKASIITIYAYSSEEEYGGDLTYSHT